jgi:hypothetical protein
VQILRWQRKRPHDGAPAEVGTSNSSTQHTHQDAGRPQLVLTLQDATEQPAAMAVLAALYGAKPMPELLSELSQEQHLQAAMLADMYHQQQQQQQLPAISTAAASCLADCLKSQGTLPEAVTQQLLRLQAVPDCLQPLFKQVLLHLLGNLEQCWADSALSDQLLQLPLSSMELLLSSDELKVGSLKRLGQCESLSDVSCSLVCNHVFGNVHVNACPIHPKTKHHLAHLAI